MATVQRSCPAGTFLGLDRGDYHTFYSIPYSTIPDPFQAPEHLLDAGTVEATEPEGRDIGITITIPANATQRSELPVVAFIHGGRNETGHHDSPGYIGESFANSGCVYVSIGYRKQFEGFANFPEELPGQYRGVQDCAVALEWIQRNIEAFGGDPTNVTVMGHSAGAAIALWLTRKDYFCGAFRRIIALSPAFPRRGFQQRLRALGVVTCGNATKQHLAAMSASRRRGVYQRFRGLFLDDLALGLFPFDPSDFGAVPILLSCTREEMYLDLATSKIDRLHLGKLLIRTRGKALGCNNPEHYLTEVTREEPTRIAGRFIGDSTIRRWGSAIAEHAPAPVWLMEFVGTPDQPACHCVDLPLIFNNLHTNPSRVEELLGPDAPATRAEVAQSVHELVLSFIAGAPPNWKRYTQTERISRSISLDGSAEEVIDPLAVIRNNFHT